MSRNSRPPSIPPLKLSISDAIIRGRSPNGRRAPDADDPPDPQAGGEFSGRDSTPRDTATGRTEAQEKPKSAATQQAAAEVEQETGTDAALRSTSRVRELISKFDKNPRTATKPSKLPTRNANTPEINETPTSGKGKRCESPKKTTPRDDASDVDTSLPDVSEYTDSSMAGLLSIEEEANQNSTMHARWLQQTEDFKTYVEPRQISSARINHRRNSSAGSKPKRTFMENQPKERTSTRAHRSAGGTPLSVLFNAPSPVRRVAAVETGQASSPSRLSVTKLETRTLKDQTGREATACAQRASHVDKSPRHTPPPTNHSPKIRVKWDGPPANGGSSSVAAPGESSLDNIRSRQHKKLMADIANPPCDSATEFNYSASQGPIASFAVHEPLLQPPCRAADRPVFEPSDGEAPAGEDSPRPSSDHNQPSNEHTTTTTTDKLKQGVAYFLSLLWTIPEKVMLIVVLTDWVTRLLRSIPHVRRSTRVVSRSQPSSPRRSAHEQQVDERTRELMNRGVLLIVLLSCCAFLATDFCSL